MLWGIQRPAGNRLLVHRSSRLHRINTAVAGVSITTPLDNPTIFKYESLMLGLSLQ